MFVIVHVRILQDIDYFHVTPDTYIVYATASPYFQSILLNLTPTFILVVKSLSTLLEEYPKIYRATSGTVSS